jgi:Mrp family chromosome partitioning ATPase
VPAYPRKLPIVLVATLSTFLVMLMVLITRELASGRAFVVSDAAPRRGEPWEKVDPASLDAEPAKPAPAPRDVYAERVVALLPRLADRGDGRRAKRVLVTGALDGSGATTLAASITRAAAAKGARVVLVDAHLKRPGVATALGLGAVPGVTDALLETAKLGAAIHRDPVSRAHVMPIGTSGAMLTEIVFEGPRFHTLIAALEAAYDHVIVDMPPVVESDATTAFAALADVALIATRGEGMDDVTVATLEALTEAGAKGVAAMIAPELPPLEPEDIAPAAKAA